MKKILALRIRDGLLASALAVGCGSSKKKKKKSSAPDDPDRRHRGERSGTALKMTAPRRVEAGLTKITFKNDQEEAPTAQLVEVDGQPDRRGGRRRPAGAGARTASRCRTGCKLEGGPNAGPGQTGEATLTCRPASTTRSTSSPTRALRLEVTGQPGGGQPSAGSTIKAVDYSFTATGLKTGQQTVLFDNEGKQPHFVVGGPLNPGKTIDDVKKVVRLGGWPSGPPPFDEKSAFSTTVVEGGDQAGGQPSTSRRRASTPSCASSPTARADRPTWPREWSPR